MNEKQPFWKRIFRKDTEPAIPEPVSTSGNTPKGEVQPLDITPNDPLLQYVNNAPGVIEVDKLNLDSPTLQALKDAGVKLTLPLVSQGDLIGLLNLGSRMSEQEYSSDDYRLLNNLATQASPALRVAQLARQQLAEAQERERIEQELRVARVIQETLLPREIPSVPGWNLSAYWQPAREVSGDFYDFIFLPDSRLGILVADVTDKGVPAAMVMATSRSILRAAAERINEPGEVLARANEVLHPDIPAKMFVTCLYLVLDPETGHIQYANAGHNLPYLRTNDGVLELRATGMPLGLLPGMAYEQKEVTLQPGQSILLSSDGIVEAHNAERVMFGFPRLQQMMFGHPGGEGLIAHLMDKFNKFTGKDYEQEDDITLVTLERVAVHEGDESSPPGTEPAHTGDRSLGAFSVPSEPGNERDAASRVLEAISPLNLPESKMKKVETAVAEATMNAMEHGNKFDKEIPVEIDVAVKEERLSVRITDQGTASPIPRETSPDIEAKLAGEQSPRGWGLFLIRSMVDELVVNQDETQHALELLFDLYK